MILQGLDLTVIVAYFLFTLAVGIWTARRAGRNAGEFFLSGRSMPWWLLGISMVATTFSTDTPNLVADITRRSGVSGNWVWWAFLLTGMLTVFVYAALWRRSGVVTDLEFYELRYSGRPAAFLRGFRAIYLGFFFNVMVMAAVTLAAIKIGGVLFGLSPVTTVAVAGTVTVVFSAAGGLRSVILTDLVLFGVAMVGSVVAAMVAVNLPAVGGLRALMAHPGVVDRLALVPDFSKPDALVPLFLIPLAVQWWAAWYPGSEPGGGGYVAQRMLAARDEQHAVSATMLFNAAHYALRPWPWILVALASLVVFPDLEALRLAFPQVDPTVMGHDLAYPAMLTFLPAGWLGLVVGSLAAAYMSTISTHLNWGGFVSDPRLLPAVPAPRGRRPGTGAGRPGGYGLPDGRVGAPGLAAGERPAGFPDPVADRRRHGPTLHPALVLVANQCLERDCRHGDLLRGGGLLRLHRSRARRVAGAVDRSRDDDRRLARCDMGDAAHLGGDAVVLLPGGGSGRAGLAAHRRRGCRLAGRSAMAGEAGTGLHGPGLGRHLWRLVRDRQPALRSAHRDGRLDAGGSDFHDCPRQGLA